MLAERIQTFKLSVLFLGATATFRLRCKSIAILQSDRRCPTCRQAKAPRRSTSATIYSTPVHRRRTDEVQDCSAWQVQVSTDRQKARTDPSASRAKSNTCPQLIQHRWQQAQTKVTWNTRPSLQRRGVHCAKSALTSQPPFKTFFQKLKKENGGVPKCACSVSHLRRSYARF